MLGAEGERWHSHKFARRVQSCTLHFFCTFFQGSFRTDKESTVRIKLHPMSESRLSAVFIWNRQDLVPHCTESLCYIWQNNSLHVAWLSIWPVAKYWAFGKITEYLRYLAWCRCHKYSAGLKVTLFLQKKQFWNIVWQDLSFCLFFTFTWLNFF